MAVLNKKLHNFCYQHLNKLLMQMKLWILIMVNFLPQNSFRTHFTTYKLMHKLLMNKLRLCKNLSIILIGFPIKIDWHKIFENIWQSKEYSVKINFSVWILIHYTSHFNILLAKNYGFQLPKCPLSTVCILTLSSWNQVCINWT